MLLESGLGCWKSELEEIKRSKKYFKDKNNSLADRLERGPLKEGWMRRLQGKWECDGQ